MFVRFAKKIYVLHVGLFLISTLTISCASRPLSEPDYIASGARYLNQEEIENAFYGKVFKLKGRTTLIYFSTDLERGVYNMYTNEVTYRRKYSFDGNELCGEYGCGKVMKKGKYYRGAYVAQNHQDEIYEYKGSELQYLAGDVNTREVGERNRLASKERELAAKKRRSENIAAISNALDTVSSAIDSVNAKKSISEQANNGRLTEQAENNNNGRIDIGSAMNCLKIRRNPEVTNRSWEKSILLARNLCEETVKLHTCNQDQGKGSCNNTKRGYNGTATIEPGREMEVPNSRAAFYFEDGKQTRKLSLAYAACLDRYNGKPVNFHVKSYPRYSCLVRQ